MKKIIYIANVRMPTEKAHGYQIMKMCEALAGHGSRVELVVPHRNSDIAEDPFRYWNIKPLFSITTLDSFDALGVFWFPRGIAFFMQAFSFARKALQYIGHSDADVIYVRDREIALLSFMVQKPFIWEVHFLPRFLFLYRPLLKKMFRIGTITRYMRNRLIQGTVNARDIIVLPDAVDIDAFAIPISQKDARAKTGLAMNAHMVLYAGQLLDWKGVDTLLAASIHLSPDIYILVIGGHDSEIQKLRKIPHHNVIFIGRKKASEIPLWLKSADILVLPNSARYEISRHYTSPLKLFEYMASHRPIVASDLPSLREIVTEDDVIFFRPDDPKDLARVIQSIFKNPTIATARLENAFQKAMKYTWEKRADIIVKNL